MVKIIGIAGQLACGKDTIADYVGKKLGSKWQRVGFAHALKKVFMDSFNVSWDFIEQWKRKDEVPEGFNLNIRKSLQHVGDGFRQIKSDIWIDIALRGDNYKIISDVRYLNEGEAIRKANGVSVLVWRPGFENSDPNPSESQIWTVVDYCRSKLPEGPIPAGHGNASLFDYFFINDGDLETMFAKVDKELIPYLLNKGVSVES